MSVELNFMIAGEAGQGVQSIGFLLAKAFSRGGYYIFADQDYESRIRGGHNFFRIRVRDSEVGAISENIDLLIAMNEESIGIHESEVVDNGVILFNADEVRNLESDKRYFAVPLNSIAKTKTGSIIMANTVAVGAAMGLVGYKLNIVEDLLKELFDKDEIKESNIVATRAGYEFAVNNYGGNILPKISPLSSVKNMLLSGNEAVSLGAIAADCKFVAAYPMTPSTSIMEYLASRADAAHMVVVQPEDEISAVNMIIGASFAGVRSMTATSGSGFCLMIEGLGLAGITETPIVIVDGQRPGPAVGLPTRTEQGDLLFAIHAHHGDFPRVVFAPATVEEAFWITVKAFNLADRYQIPVIILTDHYLASSYNTVSRFELSKLQIDRGLLYEVEKEGIFAPYMRHRITETGISPRAFPGNPDALVVTDSDEHDENGHLIEDARIRTEQVQKRMRKIISLKKDMALPKLYGPKDAETMFIGWGSTYGALREAVAKMLEEGASVSMLHLSELWPFPADAVSKAIDNTTNCFVVENNATGQLARLIKQETGKVIDSRILKFNGRPFTPEQIIVEFKGVY